jgi:hypothetical protein
VPGARAHERHVEERERERARQDDRHAAGVPQSEKNSGHHGDRQVARPIDPDEAVGRETEGGCGVDRS